jgi:hypothetical protein
MQGDSMTPQTDDGAEQTGQDPDATQTPIDPTERIRRENEQLRQRIQSMLDRQEQLDQQAEQFEHNRQANTHLRRRCSELELHSQLNQAAETLGISPRLAETFAHRFQTQIDEDGKVHISPNPTETLLAEMQSNPLLKASRTSHKAREAMDDPLATEDPSALLAQLDRNPERKAQFIARHGTNVYLDLADRSRRNGPGDG